MDRWAGALYGDPCRECAFAFSTGLDESLAYVEGVPDLYSALLAGADGTERHPDLSWSAGDMALEDVARGVAHDSFHHAWDIRRSLGWASSPPE